MLPAGLLWLAVATAAADPATHTTQSIAGLVRDSAGAPVAGAQVTVFNAQRNPVAATRSDAGGRFQLELHAPDPVVVQVEVPGLAAWRGATTPGSDRSRVLEIVLGPAPRREEVTVTAVAGRVESIGSVPQAVSVIGEDDIALRAKAVVAQVAAEEPGVQLQRTSSSMSGIFVRGLTGNKVNVFVDGVRYTNAAQRGGVNTFLNLIDPGSLERVEILRGPESARYGSDALGGSVQFLTRSPAFAGPDGPRWRGRLGTSFSSADAAFGSTLTASYAGASFGVDGTLAGRRVSTLRAGDARDSHNAVTRFLGLASDLVLDGGRLPDTAFTQYGGQLKAGWAPTSASFVTASYGRSQQDGGKRYDQLLGGDGNLVAELRNLMLDRATLRYDRTLSGWAHALGLGYSFNSQREERVNQGGQGNPRAAVNHEYERTSVHGLQASLDRQAGRHALRAGGDVYHERVTAPSFAFDPVTGGTAIRRGRVPDRALFVSGGIFVQDVFEAVPRRLRVSGSLRWNAASYQAREADSPVVNGQTLWPDDSLGGSDFGFRVGAILTPSDTLSLTASVSRGFRFPHVTDLGTLGLTGSGFEVAAPDVAGLGGFVGSTADRTAVSTGDAVRQLGSETSFSWEAGLRYRRGRVDSDLHVFLNDIGGNIQKQALILPPGAVGTRLGDQVVTQQTPAGAVFVPVSTSPVLVRANFDRARLWGFEHTLEAHITSAWSVSTVLNYVHARDRDTGRPPNIEGGTPAPEAYLKLRYRDTRRRFWLEPLLHAALRQDDLSSLDSEDRRTGAARSRSSITNFFNRGARQRGLVGAGADGVPGNADDTLLATGEVLGQVLDRVLGPGVESAPLYLAVPGYVALGLRGGLRLGARHELLLELENLTDRNYRGISWGMDAPGRGVYLNYRLEL